MIERSYINPKAQIPHPELVNIYDSNVGEGTKIACFVEIGGATIGKNCKIEAFVFIPPGTLIEDDVFVGPHVSFTNDKYPRARGEWRVQPVIVRRGASIGAGAEILAGVVVGEGALIGEGATVTRNVEPFSVVYNPDHAVLQRMINP